METVTAVKGVGDVNSNSRGSGARFNTGKAPFELLPLSVVLRNSEHDTADRGAGSIIQFLGAWQSGGGEEIGHLKAALATACGGAVTLEALADAAHVFDYGRKKYAEWNWAKGMPWSIPMACAVRHCLAILRGEDVDPESGHPHIGHVKCNLIMLLVFAETYPEGDDRPLEWLAPS